jgi:hypothetical protein
MRKLWLLLLLLAPVVAFGNEAGPMVDKTKQLAKDTEDTVKHGAQRVGRAAHDMATETAAGVRRGYHKAKKDLEPKEHVDVE